MTERMTDVDMAVTRGLVMSKKLSSHGQKELLWETERARRAEAEQEEIIRKLREVMEDAAQTLDLAADHPANPGSTNGFLVQTANRLREATK